MKNIPKTAKLILAVVICELAGIVGSIFTVPSIGTWYAHLIKPSFAPPNWVFAPIWTTLFALMGISLFLIWNSRSHNSNEKKSAYRMFTLQLLANVIWSIIFFGLHAPGIALIEIVILWLLILATIISFYKISKPAACLLIPYIIWVSIATALNFALWTLNS
ncbi:MAG: TspO/MBR family protein [Candidatus Taylorbacteria bacterium]